MADVKLGNLTFEGVDSVKLDTTDGGEVVFTIDSQARAIENALLSHTLSGEYRNDTPMEDLQPYAFAYNSDLEKVDLPNATGEIREHCFERCKNLKSVNLPKITRLMEATFWFCDALTVIDLPKVYSISLCSFAGCPLLKAVVLRNTDIVAFSASDNVADGSEFPRTPIQDGTGYFYVPRELVAAYGAWDYYFANQFRAIEDYTVDGTITGELDLTKMGL